MLFTSSLFQKSFKKFWVREGRVNQEAAMSLVMPESYIRYYGPQIMIMLWPSWYVGFKVLIW